MKGSRVTSRPDQDFVVFLIGMRVNRWWRVDKWLPVAMAMPRMLVRLHKDRSLGMLGFEQFFRLFPVTTCLVSYWRTFEDVERFARDPEQPHLGAWGEFNRRVGKSGVVGVWHETFQVSRQGYEGMYVNMPPFGMGRAFGQVAVGPGLESAKERIG